MSEEEKSKKVTQGTRLRVVAIRVSIASRRFRQQAKDAIQIEQERNSLSDLRLIWSYIWHSQPGGISSILKSHSKQSM